MTQINFEDAAAWADEPIPAEYTPGVAPWKWKPEIIHNAASTLKFLLAENARLQARLDSKCMGVCRDCEMPHETNNLPTELRPGVTFY